LLKYNSIKDKIIFYVGLDNCLYYVIIVSTRQKGNKMKKHQKQEQKIENGIRYNVCPLCNNIVQYPDGVHYAGGQVEVHPVCERNKRLNQRLALKGIK